MWLWCLMEILCLPLSRYFAQFLESWTKQLTVLWIYTCFTLSFIRFSTWRLQSKPVTIDLIGLEQVMNKKALHLSVGVIAAGWIIFIVFDKRLTINEFGLCGFSSLRYNTVQWFFPIFTISSNLAYLGFALYTYYYFKKHMPVNDSLVKRIYH